MSRNLDTEKVQPEVCTDFKSFRAKTTYQARGFGVLSIYSAGVFFFAAYCLNGFFSILSTNCFFSLLSCNCFFSLFSVNCLFSIFRCISLGI